MIEYSKEALKDLADRIQNGEHPPIPLYDENHKQIGQVTKVWFEDNQLKYEGELVQILKGENND